MFETIRSELFGVLERIETQDKHERNLHRQLQEEIQAALDGVDDLENQLTRIRLMESASLPVRQRETQEYPE